MDGLVTFGFEKSDEFILGVARGDDVHIERCPSKAVGSHGQTADHGERLTVLLKKGGDGADDSCKIHMNPIPGYRFLAALIGGIPKAPYRRSSRAP